MLRRIIKPGYVDPVEFGGGETLTFYPPILFRDVSARAFPLKANMARLCAFCDQYLNLDISDEIVHFTPALPYVYFMALNYGGMSATTRDAQRMGWVAQHEAFFMIPLQRWRRENGKLEFKGWTSVSPFIFVDDPSSMAIGREVYGWPKALCSIDATRPEWTSHPRAPTRLFTMSVDMFADVFAGEREPSRTLVTIERDAVASYAEYPPNTNCPWFYPTVFARLYSTSLALMEEAADVLGNLRLRGYPDVRNANSLVEMARESFSLYQNMIAGISPLSLPNLFGAPLSGTGARTSHVEDLPRYFSSTINLKQFRDPADTDLACYSALVESAMGVERLNQIGMLGDWDYLRGDPSGGYSIGIRRYAAQPIIETLGIEVPNAYRDTREGDVVVLRPSFPFWMDVDLYYGAGDVICSRRADLDGGAWVEESSAAGGAGPRRSGVARARDPSRGVDPNAYNTTLGAATLPVMGPMHFPDLTMEVYPLLADREKLQKFLDWYWNRLFEGRDAPPKLRLELMGSYVYLTMSIVGDAYGEMWSATENIGRWAEREASFTIPVRWMSEGRLVGVAMIEPLVFDDKPRAVATYREVEGRNSVKATIESPPDVWTSPGGPEAPRRLTRVFTESFVEIGYGQQTKTSTLIEIDGRAPLDDGDLEDWRDVAAHWGRALADDLHRKSLALREAPGVIKDVGALCLESLARGAPLDRLTLKQYRDAVEFNRACYQAVVRTQRRIERVHAIREIERPPHVALHRLANFPIVQTLGLKVKHTRSAGVVVDYLEPVRPFWMRVALSEDLGQVVATVDPNFPPETQGDPPRQWKFAAPTPNYFEKPGLAPIGARLVDALRERDGRNLTERVDTLSRRMLTKELHWLRRGVPEMPEEQRNALTARLPPDLARAIARPDNRPPPDGTSFAAFLASVPLARLIEFADALAAARPDVRPAEPRRERAVWLERLAGLVVSFEQLSPSEKNAALERNEDAETRQRCEALIEVFASPNREPLAELREADAVSLYELCIAFARALSTAPGDQPGAPAPANNPQRSAPPSASTLIGLIKQVEHWIVRPVGVEPAMWPELISESAKETLDQLRISRFVAEYALDAEWTALLEATLDFGAWTALRDLAKTAGEGSFAERQRNYDAALARGVSPLPLDPTAALAIVADAFAGDVKDWLDPARWLRMTRTEARLAVANIEDIQLAFEAILDDKWTQDVAPRERVPRIPASCVGPLGRPGETWAGEHGLARVLGHDEFVAAENRA